MSERSERLLKQLCLILALILIYPVVRLATRDDGLRALPKMELPSIPTASVTNASPIQAPPSTPPDPNQPNPNLPEAVRLQVEKITQSEILGPIVRPQPVALLGIAGRDAFVRSPSGATGLLREGETLDGIKLLRVGTNRVLIEESGKQRELMMFSGLGSETLLPKATPKPKPSSKQP